LAHLSSVEGFGEQSVHSIVEIEVLHGAAAVATVAGYAKLAITPNSSRKIFRNDGILIKVDIDCGFPRRVFGLWGGWKVVLSVVL